MTGTLTSLRGPFKPSYLMVLKATLVAAFKAALIRLHPVCHLSKDSTLAITYSPLLFRLRSSRRHFFKKTELKVQGAISLEPIISTSRRLPGGFLKVLQGLNLP